MICRNCAWAAARARIPASATATAQPRRFLSRSIRLANAAPASSATTASSSSASASASAPTPRPPDAKPKSTSPDKKTSLYVKSSIPAGQPLRGLNFLKNKQDPIALADDQYPEWLWTLLEKEKDGKEGAEGDLYAKSKKQRRIAAKRLRKEHALHPEHYVPKIPLYEQTIDLPAGDGTLTGAREARGAREELNHAMRKKRRGDIKEANFLKAMR